jgi:poly(3-hydroxybutyrate) depolymerase
MPTARTTSTRRVLRGTCTVLAAAAFAGLSASTCSGTLAQPDTNSVRSAGAAAATPDNRDRGPRTVRVWEIEYRSHTGALRSASVVLPAWYGPQNNPVLPVVVSPHGRGATGRSNATFFGNLPAVGGFAVISPDGMGARLPNFSYGAPGQIDDLARMPQLARHALPWLRLDRTRVFALGSSMGGQETLLLVARHPRVLAGAAALDSVTDLARRYRQLPQLPCASACVERWGKPYGLVLQSTLGRELGGSPSERPARYASRSGLNQAGRLASAGVPLQIWWSTKDRIVRDQKHQSQALFTELRGLNRCAPVSAYVGGWAHSHEMRADALLPIALDGFGLLPGKAKKLPASVRHQAAPACADRASAS